MIVIHLPSTYWSNSSRQDPESTLRSVLSTSCCYMMAELAIDNTPALESPHTGHGRGSTIRLRTPHTSFAAWLDSTPYCALLWAAGGGHAAVVDGFGGGSAVVVDISTRGPED